MSKKVLMVLTSHAVVEGTEVVTGWYLPECAHPYSVFKKAGYEVDFASIKGGDTTVSPSSLDMKDEENKLFWETPETKALTQGTTALAEFKGSDYDAIFYVGGFGVMWDFPFSPDVDRVGREAYENGGVLAAVCHGPICYANIKGSDGKLLIEGKNTAGFTEEEEGACGMKHHLPTHEGLGQSCEEVLTAIGGNYSKVAAWGCHAVRDGRIVSGQNPGSAQRTAALVVEALSA